MKESELTEAERACISIYQRLGNARTASSEVKAAKELGCKILKSLEPRVKQVFPSTGYYISHLGEIHKSKYGSGPLICNSFRTKKEAYQKLVRLKAQARVIEKINIANKGKNGFLLKEVNNFFMYYYYEAKEIFIHRTSTTHGLSWWEYIRTDQAAETLRNDEEFVKDWKLIKGIKA